MVTPRPYSILSFIGILAGPRGVTRTIIAHRRETIAAADRVLVMANGRLHDAFESGPPSNAAALTVHP